LLHALSACTAFHRDSEAAKLSCDQHANIATSLNDWATKNFNQAYRSTKDVTGATVQLFLIEQKAPSQFASSFNFRQTAAIKNMDLAKSKGCDIGAYPLPPIDEFKRQLAELQSEQGGASH
jgi:hypothetical protein